MSSPRYMKHINTPLYKIYESQERLRKLCMALDRSGFKDLAEKVNKEHMVLHGALEQLGVPFTQNGEWEPKL